jgi:hypothetical protein
MNASDKAGLIDERGRQEGLAAPYFVGTFGFSSSNQLRTT